MPATRATSPALLAALAAALLAACSSSSSTPSDPGGGGVATCGDGVRAAGEQCDDGNAANLDGCDATCRFEQVLRADALAIAWDTSATCAANAFGGAVIHPVAQGMANSSLAQRVRSGALGLMLQVRGLDDLTGGADAGLEVGVFAGAPHPATAFDNAAQKDQWFTAEAGTLGANRLPFYSLPAAAAGGVTTAGPGRIDLPFSLMSPVAPLTLTGARLRYTAGAATAPAVSAGGAPGHLAGEHLDPALASFQSAAAGELCGAIPAFSLATFPLDGQLITACAGYTEQNGFLDLLVGGCPPLTVPTQPDGVDTSAPVLGAGGPYTLVADGGKRVTGCQDRTGAPVNLTLCLAAATYSTRLTFAADRVVVRPGCGDAVIQAGEACDDGNGGGGDGCSAACAVEAGWTCTGSPSACVSECGNGTVDAGEQCDDGNRADLDGCSPRCEVEPGYTCTGAPSICSGTCGDFLLAAGEQCDDGNFLAGDGCDALCQQEPGWLCQGEPSACMTFCGDGIPAAGEACDDGNMQDGDGCSAVCQVETGFSCSGAPSACASTCGDGLPAGGEACDDGNASDGDGCSATCQQEPGWACQGVPSVCMASCGDGIPAAGEACDDGNMQDGDGCSAACQVEPGRECTGAPSVCLFACAPGACGDGNFCNGVETCDPLLGCQAGAPPSCDDGVSCTADTCNPGTGACFHVPSAAACDDGDFCNGAETCGAAGCQAGAPPSCDDGDACTTDGCNPVAGACTHAPVPALIQAIDANGALVSIDPSRYGIGAAELQVGAPACGPGPALPGMGTPATPYALAVGRDQVARVLYTSGELFEVSTADAACAGTAFQPRQASGGVLWDLFGLAYAGQAAGSAADVLFAAGGPVSGLDGSLGVLAGPSLAITRVGALPAGQRPELMGLADGTLWGFFPGAGPDAFVQRLDPASGALLGSPIPVPLPGLLEAWAAAPWGSSLWIFTTTNNGLSSNAAVREVFPATGQVRVVVQNQPRTFVAAGASTCATR